MNGKPHTQDITKKDTKLIKIKKRVEKQANLMKRSAKHVSEDNSVVMQWYRDKRAFKKWVRKSENYL